MPVRYGRFEMPKTLTKDESTATETYAKFVAEPFEAGYGHTIGNSLRRVLLSSLEGAAITAVKITGEENKRADQPIGLIPIDSIFSPVTRVKYAVENTRVGQRTDYDKLLLEVWTDGRLTPDEALLQGSAILRHHLDVFVNFNEDVIEFDETPAGVSEENVKLKKLLNMSVNEIELSVRAANCLNNANITTVGQLAQKTEAEMLKYRNFGKKSLNEIKDKLQQLGLGLGQKFDPGLVEIPISADGANGAINQDEE